MTRRIALPGIVDILRIDDPATILGLARETRVDRVFDDGGPILNRRVMRRIRRALSWQGKPFTAVAPRDDPARRDRQTRLEADLAALVEDGRPADGSALDRLAAYVRGEISRDAAGQAAQQAVGRLFADGYEATRETWDAAKVIDAAPRSRNPLRRLVWALTDAVGGAQRALARRVDGDAAAMHATAVAVHSLVRSLDAMRGLWADPAIRASTSADAAAFRSLRAPLSLPRRCTARAMTASGEMRDGTLVLIELEAARRRSPGPEMTFMTGTWSQCPAHAWVPALLRAVWERASATAKRAA